MQELSERRRAADTRLSRAWDGAELPHPGDHDRDLNAGTVVTEWRAPDGSTLVLVRLVGAGHSEGGATRAGVDHAWGPSRATDAGTREVVSERYGLAHCAAEQTFYLDGIAMDLAPREYRLLRYFAERPRRVLSYARLLEGAWPNGFGEDANPLQVALCRLRRQLGDAGELIETRRGSGYLFASDAPLRAPEW